MNTLDGLKQILAHFNYKWPYTGALGDAHRLLKNHKPVQETIKILEIKQEYLFVHNKPVGE